MSNCCRRPRRQRGDILLESLIGVLITALIGGGMAFLCARLMDSQREAGIERLAVERLRNSLLDQGLALCGTSPTLSSWPGGGAPAATVHCPAPVAVTVTLGGTGYAVAPPAAVRLEVAAAALGLAGGGTDAGQPLVVGTQQ